MRLGYQFLTSEIENCDCLILLEILTQLYMSFKPLKIAKFRRVFSIWSIFKKMTKISVCRLFWYSTNWKTIISLIFMMMEHSEI